jgi:2,3-bisphosphoglycerate-independent phosphoglycerate mutase
VKNCEKKIATLQTGQIATIAGRYYAMDRDNRLDRTMKAYSAMADGIGQKFESASFEIGENYKKNITDEFILPSVHKNYSGIHKNDAIIIFNFRADRTLQIVNCFAKNNAEKLLTFTKYDADLENISVAFEPLKIYNTFGEYISKNKLKQLRIAETEKYAHVTFFFNGGAKLPFKNEERILIPSPKIATYDLKPEMSSFEIADTTIKNLELGIFDVVVINFANCDMLGHTGNFAATVKAVEAVDEAIGKILKTIKKLDGVGVITADHGNAEKLFNKNNAVFTSHTTNTVPFCIFNYECSLKKFAGLCDVAPTLLEILNLKKPAEMTGESIILQKITT